MVADEVHSLLILADGMGGHKAGEMASRLAVDSVLQSLQDWLGKCTEQTISRNLKKAVIRFVHKANNQIYLESLLDYEKYGMGTTIVVAVVRKNKLTFAHVGDSRAYLLRDKSLIRLTVDHSRVQEQINNGIITLEQSVKSPLRNFLTRALGTSKEVQVDAQQIVLNRDDKILLCSDGLTDMLNDHDIEKTLNKGLTLEKSITELINGANAAGGLDNISVALGVAL